MIDLRHEAGRQLVVLEQRLGLKAHALTRQRPRVARHAQIGQRLLQDDRFVGSVFVLNDEDQIQIAVAHLLRVQRAIDVEHSAQASTRANSRLHAGSKLDRP